MNNTLKAAAFASLVSLSTLVTANPYIGATVGQSDVDESHFDKATSYSFLVGYGFAANFAVEAGYLDLGEADDNIPPEWTISADGFFVNLVGILPLSNTFSGYAKIGVYAWDASLEEEGYGELASNDGEDWIGSLGLKAALAPQVDINLEYSAMQLNDVDVENISLGVIYNF